MTPSVSPQNALIDCAIFAATVFAAMALILISDGPVWGPPHGAIVVMARCSAVPNDNATRRGRLQPRRVSALTSARLALNPDGHPYPVPVQRVERSSLFNGAAKTAIQPIAVDGVPITVIPESGLIAKRRGELRCGTANCRDRQEDLFVVRIGCDRVYRARITRGNGRVAVLRRDKNRLVQLECV